MTKVQAESALIDAGSILGLIEVGQHGVLTAAHYAAMPMTSHSKLLASEVVNGIVQFGLGTAWPYEATLDHPFKQRLSAKLRFPVDD